MPNGPARRAISRREAKRKLKQTEVSPAPPEELVPEDRSEAERELEIPHHRVRLKDGILLSVEPKFVEGVTHELRTPLNVIIGLCQLLERDREAPLSPDQRDTVDRMERNAQSLLHSINNLLARLRTGRLD